MTLYYITEQGALSEAIEFITGARPPFDLSSVLSQADLADETVLSLCDWCSGNAKPVWATGESIYDAAQLLVERAIENDNIQEQRDFSSVYSIPTASS